MKVESVIFATGLLALAFTIEQNIELRVNLYNDRMSIEAICGSADQIIAEAKHMNKVMR